ncbi:uncharacterized protein LOC129729279 [Wyeomyia smithii]|uniref:uncharacterized protein LOC129729279 n=1 Tax=Wyeomyia smithii TaxID=174621 RepID=UPI002467F3A9|nr:uncharacterized protein LOC129729279 [Wyeomyia smithii]
MTGAISRMSTRQTTSTDGNDTDCSSASGSSKRRIGRPPGKKSRQNNADDDEEVENDQISLPGYNIECNIDHSRRGTAIALKDHLRFSNVERSLDGRLIALRLQNTTICNVYAPSGKALRAERERFLNSTLAYYIRHPTEHTVIGGDFNCVVRRCDSTGNNHSPALSAFVQQLNLLDVWVQLRPTIPGYTYITHNSSSRLDRIYVSQSLQAVFNDFHQQHQRLYRELRQAYDGYFQNQEMLSTINRVKAKMLTLQRNFTQAIMRTNESFIAGEPISMFQLGNRRRKKTNITQLRDEENQLIDDSTEIERHMLRFYQSLYAAGETEEDAENIFECERVIPENDPVSESCMHEITAAEIFTAIKSSSPNKSPGGDSLPREFYLKTYDVIWRELTLVINETLSGNFPPEFVDGVIVLVKKKSNNQTASSYRPISLLNFDYKILSRILKQRLESVMSTHHVLTDSQKCANTGRNIFQATLAMKDRIARLTKCKQRGLLASFDLRHAFDVVDRTFLFRNMCSLGFEPNLVRLLKKIGDLSSSRLLVNGHLSAAFPIQRSVCQGDPLSMHLFVLYLHPLLKQLDEICESDLVVAYADDVTVICTCLTRMERIREIIQRFERVSGARLSLEKSTSLSVGYTDVMSLTVPWLRNENTVRILGVTFAKSIRLMNKLNWDAIVLSFSRQIYLHSLRTLNLNQKVILLNTFITSKIWYLASVLTPTAAHTAKLTATMRTFLWRGVAANVPMQQLARSKETGGLKLHLPALKCKALLLNRHMRGINSLPFYMSLLSQANPALPIDCPCLKLILKIRTLPPHIQQNISSEIIHNYYIEQTETPKGSSEYPTANWRLIWKNISMRSMNSSERSFLFLIINRKLECRKLMFRINRADGKNCPYCNVTVETLEHKLSECTRVEPAWRTLQRKLNVLLNG